jgi:hypothetical protein
MKRCSFGSYFVTELHIRVRIRINLEIWIRIRIKVSPFYRVPFVSVLVVLQTDKVLDLIKSKFTLAFLLSFLALHLSFLLCTWLKAVLKLSCEKSEATSRSAAVGRLSGSIIRQLVTRDIEWLVLQTMMD